MLADTATKKARPEAGRVTPGLADGRTADERMRDVFAERYDPELKRLSGLAAAVDNDLQSYLAACFERFASIKVEGAAPRSTAVDDILKAARSSPGAARFALWSGTAAFQWNETWAPQPNDSSLDAVLRPALGGRPRSRRSPEGRPRIPRARRPRARHLSRRRAEMLAARGLAEQSGSRRRRPSRTFGKRRAGAIAP